MSVRAPPAEPARPAIKTAVSQTLLRKLLLGVLAVWLFRQWVWAPLVLVGPSMEPTLRNGQLAGVNKLAYVFHSPRRGDVVVVQTGRGLIVKRIVGLPGEEVGARDGIFQVNGAPLGEPYVGLCQSWAIAPARLDEDSYVIAGDNRSESLTALVHRRRIVGQLVVW